ncbi:MAG: SRA-YDG domain-containing protein [Streptosporangiales bacterium]|nr:SRA-YDG domain-containing protein [Streptosporangiales bacterium]
MADENRVFGHVPGVNVGATFPRRRDASVAKVHRARQAGITGTAKTGAESIVVSGGYPDDEDYGDVIIYTGHGGRDPETKRQIRDQQLTDPGNAALVTSQAKEALVRVIRGVDPNNAYAPEEGYRYDGLYLVAAHWRTRGIDGYKICRYRLELDDGEVPVKAALPQSHLTGVDEVVTKPAPAGVVKPGRRTVSSEAVERSRVLAESIKDLHGYRCQICGFRIELPSGVHYAEAAHIRGLGRPHEGPDTAENMVVLCPNHHKQFDLGAIVIGDDLRVIDVYRRAQVGVLNELPRHKVDRAHLEYHRICHQPSAVNPLC